MIYLASKSPRRRELLTQVGIDHRVVTVDIDESVRANELPANYVGRLAREKALAGFRETGAGPVIGADTTVVVDGRILGKPESRADAHAMLQSLSGRSHEVYSGVAVATAGFVRDAVQVSTVRFATLDERWLSDYLDSDEPYDKAGAYGIQGRAAAVIEHLDGSHSGVMGLPLFETCELLRACGSMTP